MIVVSNNPELDYYYQRYQTAREQADRAYDEMQSARQANHDAREDRNRKRRIMLKHAAHYDTIWNRFYHLCNCNKARIEVLRHEAKNATASRCAAIDAEIDELNQEINDAKNEAKSRASRANKNAFHQAEYVLERIRVRYEIATTKYERAEYYCKQCEADYERAKATHEAYVNQSPN